MKILQVTTVATTIDAFLLPFSNEFRVRGWKVDAAAEGINKFPKIKESHDHCYDIGFCRNPFKLITLLRSLRDIRSLLIHGNYDIVHVHTPIASFLTRVASIGLKKTKVFYTAHGFHYSSLNSWIKNLPFYLVEKISGFYTDHLFVINSDDYNFALDKKLLPSNNITFIPGIGVDPLIYRESGSDLCKLKESLSIEDEMFTITHIAELNNNKNHITFFRSLKLFKQRNPNISFRYLIVGSGPLKTRLEKEIEALGLSSHTSFLGRRDDITNLLSISNVLVLSSLREGLPRCILEAMSCRRPIIASDIRGCRDLLSTGAGILVSADNTLGWCEAIERLSSSAELSKSMGEKGRELIESTYNLDNVLKMVLEVYEKELSHGKTPF